MAEIKKYLDTTALGTLVGQIKAEDAKALAAAKKYTDDAGASYDVAGAAATAEANAKAYTDELADGAVATNTAAIAKLNGTATTEGSVAKAIADAKATIDADIDAVETKVDKNAEDIAAINHAETGILKQAKDYTDSKVADVQADVDALDTRVGEIPEGSDAQTVIAYVQEKTAGIATDAALGELQAAVDAVETDVATIKGDYLKTADKTELEGKITTVSTGLAEVKEDVDAFLAAAEVGDAAVDTLKEIQTYIESDGAAAAEMTANIATNKAAIESNDAEIATLQSEMDAVEQKVSDNETAIASLEAKFGEGEGSVTDMIADAVAAETSARETAVAAVQEDADQGIADAAAALAAAQAASKSATDLNAAMDVRMQAVEATSHTHSNKAELDLIATGDKAKWDAMEQNAADYTDAEIAKVNTTVSGIDTRVTQNTTDIATKASQDSLDAAVARIAVNETNIAANTSAINSFTAITSDEVNALFA